MNFEIIFFIIGAIFSSNAAPDIGTCNRKDTVCLSKLFNVLLQVAMRGDPSIILETLEPMHIDLIKGDLATLNYKLTKSTAKGFINCVMQDVSVTEDDTKFAFKLHCPLLRMSGQYEINGQLLSLPVEGKGDYKLEATEYLTDIETQLEKTKSDDGKEYFSFKNFKIDGASKGGNFEATNLFNGQKDLAISILRVSYEPTKGNYIDQLNCNSSSNIFCFVSEMGISRTDAFHKFVNDNWVQAVRVVQGPVFNVVVKKVIKNLNKVFKTISVDQLLSD